MSNILKVTTPVVGYDNNAVNNKQTPTQQEQDLSIKNQVDTQRVVRADGRTEGESGQGRGITYDSNFGSFVQSLRELPNLQEIMTKLLFGGMANMVESGISKGTATDIQALFQMLEMTPEQLNGFLKDAMAGANRLQGPLFDVLRQVMDESNSVELKAGVLDMLKTYNDMSSGKHLTQTVRDLLDDIGDRMFRSNRQELRQLVAKLRPYTMENNVRNTQILKEQIIPYLGKYISQTKDMGKIRDLISLLALNTSRLENGNVDKMAQTFQRLMDFPTFQKHFKGMTPMQFKQMLMQVDYEKAAGKMEWNEKLLNIIQAGVKGEAGIEKKEDFVNMMRSMLVNESVYMPVMHVMLPVILDGVPMYSEIWADPDEESGNPESSERGVKLLIKFDLKDVGFFDMMMYYEKGKMDMLIHYPEELAGHESDIRENIRKIMNKNHLEVEYLAVEQGQVPIKVSAAFPKIFERRNAVNVTI